MAAGGPAQIRGQVGRWLAALLAGEGCGVPLEEPQDWSGWNAKRRC
jgi:hypothetical protein